MQSGNDTTCKARPHGLISSARKTGRVGTTLRVILNESRAAKRSVLSVSFQVGEIASADFVRTVGIR